MTTQPVNHTTLGFEGTYVLGEVLGRGGMGVVYAATQVSLGRRVAIKMPHPELASDPRVHRRFRAEALAGGQVNHENLARVIDFGSGDGALYLVMEYVAGASLDKILADHGPMAPAAAVEICLQLLAGLDAVHTSGIVHADIKCANVLVETLADLSMVVRVIDFGLARFADQPTLDEERTLSGTPEYLAPELTNGDAPTVASDLYAVGVVLYELLTETTPFPGGTSAEILRRHVDDDVIPPGLRCPDLDLPEALSGAIMRALAKDPSARFPNAASFAQALRDLRPALLRARTPRLTRGTHSSSFSVEATTRTWPRSPATLARATKPPSNDVVVRQARTEVRAALAAGEVDAIITSHLELVRALVDGRQLATAVVELERGLRQLRLVVDGSTPRPLWRLQLCLAALYSGAGDPARARAAAVLAQDDAREADSMLGNDRAAELLARLARHART